MGNFWDSAGNGIVSGGLGIIGSLISGAYQRKTAEEQTKLSAELGLRNAKEMAGVNYQYNEQAADNAMARSKELADYNQALGLDATQQMWNKYNSPEAKRKALQDAGLSVGLMYSGGGAQGTIGTQAANGAAPQGGTSGPSAGGTPIGMGIQLQLGKIASEAALNNALARKANEEANTEGGKNERGQGEIFLIKQQGLNQEAQAKLNNANAKLAELESNIKGMNWEAIEKNKQTYTDSIIAGMQTIIDNNEINNKTKQAQIDKVLLELAVLENELKIKQWEGENPKESAMIKAGGLWGIAAALKDWAESKIPSGERVGAGWLWLEKALEKGN